MKQITNKTVLKQGDKLFQPVEVENVIYWVDEEVVCKTGELYLSSLLRRIISKSRGVIQAGDKIVAQSQPKLEGIPVISLDCNIQKLIKKFKYFAANTANEQLGALCNKAWNILTDFVLSNSNQYTQKDIEKAIELAIESHVCAYIDEDKQPRISYDLEDTTKEILEQINAITEIEVDEQFNIILCN